MKTRVLACAAVVVLAALPLAGCVGTPTETAKESDAAQREAACDTVVDDLPEYTALLAKTADGFGEYTPSTWLSFHTGAVEKINSVAATLDDDEVKDALLALRDTSAEFVPIWEKAAANPDTWGDGSLDADIAAAGEATTTALADLGEICPGVNDVTP